MKMNAPKKRLSLEPPLIPPAGRKIGITQIDLFDILFDEGGQEADSDTESLPSSPAGVSAASERLPPK
jgi:hypothetical protein